ncbi:hypothetical protein NLZ08_15555 [Escherichia coli]|uniref:hypothetical protein n=3 Tax=Escherichia coli TaxID=562 RepID=UPI0020C36B0C|nr:hypothetical protein [Escherichia coli]UTJ65509.1 hypothetical protein NLZ08_15555 [Escherichia coli]
MLNNKKNRIIDNSEQVNKIIEGTNKLIKKKKKNKLSRELMEHPEEILLAMMHQTEAIAIALAVQALSEFREENIRLAQELKNLRRQLQSTEAGTSSRIH